jgi:hypothetical protein
LHVISDDDEANSDAADEHAREQFSMPQQVETDDVAVKMTVKGIKSAFKCTHDEFLYAAMNGDGSQNPEEARHLFEENSRHDLPPMESYAGIGPIYQPLPDNQDVDL